MILFKSLKLPHSTGYTPLSFLYYYISRRVYISKAPWIWQSILRVTEKDTA